MPRIPQISDAEWEVMKAVWEGGALTAGGVVKGVLRQQQWHPRTIKTLLTRLVKKGAIAVSVEQGRHLYRAKVAKEACRREETRSFLQRVFDGAVAPALVHFIRDANLSPQEIEQLKKILDEEAS